VAGQWGSLDRWYFESTSVIRTSMMQSVPRAQRPRIKMPPRSSVRLFWKRRLTAGLSGFPGLDLGSAAQLVWIIGSSRTAKGEKALEARLLSSSQISLCHEITSPPRLHSSAWRTLNLCWQRLHWIGRSGGQRAYRRRRASRNS
jgi:hypothetical protein